MKTVTICIGNSDNKLTQQEWSNFIERVYVVMCDRSVAVHFSGFSAGDSPWQNVCWVAEVAKEDIEPLRAELKNVRERFKQDSVAFTAGETEFI